MQKIVQACMDFKKEFAYLRCSKIFLYAIGQRVLSDSTASGIFYACMQTVYKMAASNPAHTL